MNKETQFIMKGYAILFIVLHNFCHLEQFGLPQENEMYFSLEKWDIFLNQAFSIATIIPSFFSFIGWCGVPLFVFFSGYGLSKKYKEEPLVVGKYLKHSYMKLLVMVLPVAIVYFTYNLINGNFWWVSRNIISLSFLNTLVAEFGGSFASYIAPPYWYLGMTFQLYIWFVIMRKMNNRKLLWLAILFMVPLFFIPTFDENIMILKWWRRNSFGWISFFLIGCYFGRKTIIYKLPDIMSIVLLIISTFYVLWSNSNYYLWCLLPIGAIMMFWSLGLLTSKIRFAKKCMEYVGRKSMFLFIAHPLSLSIVSYYPLSQYAHTNVNLYSCLILYLVIVFAIAFVYQYFHKKLSSKLLKKYD